MFNLTRKRGISLVASTLVVHVTNLTRKKHIAESFGFSDASSPRAEPSGNTSQGLERKVSGPESSECMKYIVIDFLSEYHEVVL